MQHISVMLRTFLIHYKRTKLVALLHPLTAPSVLPGSKQCTNKAHETKLLFHHLLFIEEGGGGEASTKAQRSYIIDAALLVSLLLVLGLNRKQFTVLQQLAGGLWKVMGCPW